MITSLRTSCLLLLTLDRADATGEWVADCTSPGYEYIPVISTPTSVDQVDGPAASAAACQERCGNHTGCAFWTFYPTLNASPATGRCTLAHLDSHPSWVGGTSPGVISGPTAGSEFCSCAPSHPTLLPGHPWPQATEALSHAAWSTGRQPVGLGCWPKGQHAGADAYQLYPCTEDVTLLQSTENGWAGECMNLDRVQFPTGNTNNAWCEEDCRANPLCPGWQVGPAVNGNLLAGGCWQGVGDHCNNRQGQGPSFRPVGAERFQHGQIQVLSSITEFQVLGLHNIMDEQYAAQNNETFAIMACRYTCYSNINCMYWQYFRETGCWLEHPMSNGGVASPLTDTAVLHSPASLTIVAGEFIQHWCAVPLPPTTAPLVPVAAAATAPTLPPASGGSWAPLIMGLIALALIAATLVAVCLFMRPSEKKPAAPKKRAVKPATPTPAASPPPPSPPPMQTPMQQVPTMSVVLPTYQHVPQVQPMQLRQAPAAQATRAVSGVPPMPYALNSPVSSFSINQPLMPVRAPGAR